MLNWLELFLVQSAPPFLIFVVYYIFFIYLSFLSPFLTFYQCYCHPFTNNISFSNAQLFAQNNFCLVEEFSKTTLLPTHQFSVNWGPNSRFVIEAISKSLVPFSRSLILKTQNRGYMSPDFEPDSNLTKYQHAYTNIDLSKDLF